MADRTGRARIAGVVAAILGLGAVVWLLGVRTESPSPDDSGNLLRNPGFEQGESHWEWLSWSKGWAPFDISTGRRHGGDRALHLPVTSRGDPRRTIVWGVMQEITVPEEFPECMDGWYLVSKWERGTRKQYLQAVLISDMKTDGGADKQIRMMITGMDEPSYRLSNARYYFADPRKPVTPPLSEWIYFQLAPRDWFLDAWGELPPAGSRLRVFYEARFDDRDPEEEVVAQVYYDDVYLGPRARGHCEDAR
jgi:hypothetical protein